ncbi:hypothetical protein B0H10DRAFT_305619 [Mycena sp. CBHHK59/15]|nr:hypothetical protein B0H10DRAFT_305619 [Mycena sp. CBHHK59/15]
MFFPSPTPRPSSEQWLTIFDGVVDFFRKAGYRRIGGTSFLGHSQDHDHPSRRKNRLEDYDPDDTFTGNKGPRFALHDTIFEHNSDCIIQLIRDAHTQDPTSIQQPGSKGFRPIYIAVKTKNLNAFRILIALGLKISIRERTATILLHWRRAVRTCVSIGSLRRYSSLKARMDIQIRVFSSRCPSKGRWDSQSRELTKSILRRSGDVLVTTAMMDDCLPRR